MVENRGGKRVGAGAKCQGKEPKRPLGVKVSEETREHLTALKKVPGHSKASIVEYALMRIKKLPNKL